MAEIQDDKERKKLYGLLVSDPATRKNTAQYSFKQWESKLLGDEENIKRVADYAVKKNWSYDQDDFYKKYAPEKLAKPQPQVQAAPAMQVAAPMEEEETYTPTLDPLVGTPEYDAKLQKQYGGMKPTLGATFGGAAASFETPEQKKQEGSSPAFKAQQLAFEDVPIASEQRKAQRQFAKVTKQEKEAALRGGTGFELQQKRANEQREATKKLKDFGSSMGVLFDNMINKAKAAEALFGAKQRALLTFGEKGKKAEEQEKKIKQQVLGYLDQVDQDFATKQAEYNIEGNIYDVISKGQLDRLPEAFAYNLAQIGINALAAGTTGGYSTFAQVVPDMYKAGVEEIARKTNITPEEVIASGKDKEVISYTAGAISGGIDYFSSGLLGSAMRSKGAYKFLRDLALDKIGKTKWKQAAASAAALGGVANIEAFTEGGQGLIEVAAPQIASAESFKEARENIYGELQKPSTQRRLASDIVGGAAGGGGLVALGRGAERVLQGDFTYGDVRKSPASQRADMDIVQTDNKIQERNKIAQAMEEAVKGNPEAEGQIREQYQKRVNEAAPTDEEVLAAYEGLALLPETEEKNTIRENLEAYMAEKGIQPEAAGMEAGLGEGMRVTAPSEETMPPAPPVEPVTPEVTPEPIAPTEEVTQEDEDLASLGQVISGLEQTPTTGMFEGIEGPTQEATPVAPAEEVAPTVTPEVVPEEVVAEETPSALPAKEVGVGGIIKGHEDIVGNEGLGDIRNELPEDNSGTIIVTGKDNNQYAVSFSRKGGDGQNIFEQTSTPRPGHIYTSVKIDNPSNVQEVEAAKRQAEAALSNILPTITKGNVKALDVQQAISDFQAKKPVEVAPTPRGKKKAAPVTPPAPKVEKPQPKKEETPKPEAKEVKPTTGTPQEGDAVEIAPQREGGSPRKMVFKDGEWKQNVGGDIVKVGPSVQGQAQEMFAGKTETKAEGIKPGAFKPNPNATYYISKGADEVFYTLREIAGDDLDVHVMNLSKDLADSKQKAKELVGEDVEFDEASLGRDYKKIKANKTGKGQKLAQRQEGEGAGMNTLSFGKYNGKTIDEVFEIDKPYILYLNKEYSNNTVFQKGVRDNPKIKEFIDQSLSEKESETKRRESLPEIGGVKFDEKGVAKGVPIKGKIKYINNRMGPQGFYKVYIVDTEYGIPVEVSGTIESFADGKLEQGTELSFTGNVQKVGDKFKVIGKKSEYKQAKPAKTNEEQIADLRAKEQAEYDSMSDPNDKAKRKEIYDRYDKLISPLMETKPAEEAPKGFTAKDGNKVVDEKGEPIIVYHGTTKGGFVNFSPEGAIKSGNRGGIFFTDNRNVAQAYEGSGSDIEIKGEYFDKDAELQKLNEQFGNNKEYKDENPVDGLNKAYRNLTDSRNSDFEKKAGYDSIKKITGSKKLADEYIATRKILSERESNISAGIYSARINIQNPLIVDFKGREWNDGIFEGKRVSTNELTIIALKRGNDGVIIKNVIDVGAAGKVKFKTKAEKVANVYVVFDKKNIELITPEQSVKSQLATETTAQAEFTSKQESSASTEFDGTKKPSKIKMNSFDGKHGKGAFQRMKNITDNFEDIMDGLSEKIKQDCL